MAKKSVRYLFFLVLSAFLLYQAALLLSLYPNDWFLSSSAYTKNPDYAAIENFKYRFICREENREDFKPYESNFNRLLCLPKTILRDHKKRTVFLIDLGTKKVILKQYKITGLFNLFQRLPIRSSPAFRNWHYGNQLLKLGITTPKPLAIYERRFGPIWTTSYVITEHLGGHCPLNEQIEYCPHEETCDLLKKIELDLKKLKLAHFIHSDYGYRNILILNHKPYLIDLDDLHQYHSSNSFFIKRFEKKHLSQINAEIKSFSSNLPMIQ